MNRKGGVRIYSITCELFSNMSLCGWQGVFNARGLFSSTLLTTHQHETRERVLWGIFIHSMVKKIYMKFDFHFARVM